MKALGRLALVRQDPRRDRVLNLKAFGRLALGRQRGGAWLPGSTGLVGGFSVAVEDGLQVGRIEDAVGPDVELVQRGGLEARGGLVIERAEAVE